MRTSRIFFYLIPWRPLERWKIAEMKHILFGHIKMRRTFLKRFSKRFFFRKLLAFDQRVIHSIPLLMWDFTAQSISVTFFTFNSESRRFHHAHYWLLFHIWKDNPIVFWAIIHWKSFALRLKVPNFIINSKKCVVT